MRARAFTPAIQVLMSVKATMATLVAPDPSNQIASVNCARIDQSFHGCVPFYYGTYFPFSPCDHGSYVATKCTRSGRVG